MESMIPCIWTSCPRPLREKQAHIITTPPPYFTVGRRCFSAWLSLCLCQTHLWCLLPKSSILVSSDHRTWSHWKIQWCLVNYRSLSLSFLDGRGLLLVTPTNILWLYRWCLIVVWEIFWPQDSTNFYNSSSVILADSSSTWTILLTVRGVSIGTRPIPDSFLTSSVV